MIRRAREEISQHEQYMKEALRLARRGRGRTGPNPMVGALVVRGKEIVGRGYHIFEKTDHAEVVALRQAGPLAKGARLYVNLEPCSHQGRTPPCVDQIVAAGIREVFVGVRDPNPLVSGRGIATLRERGIQVQEGLCRHQASLLNEKFFHFIRTGRPFVLLKLALSLDGKIATGSGQSQWITGPEARREGHRLRFEYDAILVGIGTVLQDDPSLDVRWSRGKSIVKVVLDSHLRTPPRCRLFQSGDPVLIFHAKGVRSPHRAQLHRQATLVPVSREENGLDWQQILNHLGQRRLSSLLVEGGSQVAASALRAGVVQKVRFFYAPKLIGGSGLDGIADLGVKRLDQAFHLSSLRLGKAPPDFWVEGYLPAPGAPNPEPEG